MWRNIAVGIVVVSFTFLGPRTAYTATATFGAVADTHVDLKADNTNFGTFSVNTVGLTFESFGPSTLSSVDRGLLHFDISALPANAVITSATLRLFIDATTGPTPLALNLTVFELTSSFNENTVTWNTQPAIFPSPTDMATMNALPGDWFAMDVTAIVTAVRASGDPTNVLLRVAPTDETTPDDRRFDFRSKEFGDGTDRPQLILTFQPLAAAPLLSGTALLFGLASLFAVGLLGLHRRGRRPIA